MSDNNPPKLREIITNAVRFWEIGRIFYNAILAAVVTGYYLSNWPKSQSEINSDAMMGLFILAVLANTSYCAAYLPDLLFQYSAFRTQWLKARWFLLLIGILLAVVITRFVMIQTFEPLPITD